MSNIKMFISCHKDFNTLNNDIFVPMQVGCAINKNKIEGILHDDDDEPNISHKNKMYCEMTSHYYVWKHIDADYYGFLHYRRYFSFSAKHFKTNFENIIVEDHLDEEVVKKYCLDEKTVHDTVEQYDLLIPEKRPSVGSIKASYCAAKTQSKTDYQFCCDYIKKNYPEMIGAMKKYNRSWTGYYCNMFVMKKEIFKHFAAWLFNILETHEKHFDMEHYDVQSYRVSGYLAERLTGIYITYLLENPNLKIKKLQVIKFLNCEKPKSSSENICDVVIECKKKDFLKTNVLVNSIAKNISDEHKYNILIVESHLKDYQKELLKQYQTKNLTISFARKTKSSATCFKKYVKLNNNCIVDSDIFELFDTTTSAKVAGANNLFDIIKFGKTRLDKQYAKLQKDNVYLHIDKNVLLIDNNKSTEGTQLLDLSWNLPVDQKFNITQKLYAFGSHTMYEQFTKTKKSPKIVCFHGKIKPIANDMSEMANLFWKYALSSNVFVSILRYHTLHHKQIHRSFYDTILPVGSALRDATRTYIKKY